MRYIDKSTWPRREVYDFFSRMSWPFYSLTFPVDVTALRRYTKDRGVSFYLAMVYAVTKAMDSVEAFRCKCRDSDIVLHDHLVPSFTDLMPGSETFHITTVEAGDDLEDFCRRAKAASAAQTVFLPSGPWDEDQLIYFSCLPWFPITALTNERNADPGDSVPRVSWGKYEERDGRTTLSLSLELNHRLLDGVHVGKFSAALVALLEKL
ncbi:putative chloramphenicol O-acetyltransferase [uncultured Eubacteriales bacterium]|uniref:Putative chloramphenicol O-acetyltransferase n=1 Tax=uncultured Eubacteriales bacterium TaxID=172733 RepID=A0A212KDH0_9FIRM|nr:putative chloramphenicol O-acetyltransferase [uncultured Eubacteriales bacterium]